MKFKKPVGKTINVLIKVWSSNMLFFIEEFQRCTAEFNNLVGKPYRKTKVTQ